MKIYFVRREDHTNDVVVDCHDTRSDDCNKEVFRGKEYPDWLQQLEIGVDLFYTEYCDKNDCYVIVNGGE